MKATFFCNNFSKCSTYVKFFDVKEEIDDVKLYKLQFRIKITIGLRKKVIEEKFILVITIWIFNEIN